MPKLRCGVLLAKPEFHQGLSKIGKLVTKWPCEALQTSWTHAQERFFTRGHTPNGWS